MIRTKMAGSRCPLIYGRGLLAVAARSLPDTRTVVPVPFTPPPSRVQVDTLNDQVGKQTGDKVQVNVELGDGQALDVVVSSPCTPKTRRSQPALNTPDVVVMAERQLVAECIGYDVEKAYLTIFRFLPCSKGNLKCDGRTPKSILKRSRQAVTWVDDVNQIPIVRRSAIDGIEDIWWSRAQMAKMAAMQAHPLVQSQIREAKVASQAQSTIQVVPEAHPPQPVCPQTPRCKNRGLPVSKVRLLESVDSAPICIHPVARLPSGPVQPPDATDRQKVRLCRDHTPEPPASVVLLPKNTEFSNGDSWWWPDDWKQQKYKHSQCRGEKVPRAPNHGSVDCWQSREFGWLSNRRDGLGDHRFNCFVFVAKHLPSSWIVFHRFSFILGISSFVLC